MYVSTGSSTAQIDTYILTFFKRSQVLMLHGYIDVYLCKATSTVILLAFRCDHLYNLCYSHAHLQIHYSHKLVFIWLVHF